MQQIRARISTQRIVENARLIVGKTKKPLFAVVKDDGYGHGAIAVAHALAGTAAGFCVSTVREGAALRTGGISHPILVFTPITTEEEALSCAAYSLMPTAASLASVRLLVRAEERFGVSFSAQLAVNTGMNRYGFSPATLPLGCRAAKEGGIGIVGAYSHFYAPEDEEAREGQYVRFLSARTEILRHFPQAKFHLCATGGLLAGSKYHFDCVRCGIGLYGYLPEGFEGALPVRPAMKLFATVTQRGKFTGGGAGYGRAEREFGALCTLKAGYGDGFFRAGGLGIGKLCMDACVREGDLPFGKEVCVLKDAARYAREHGTTAYEVLTAVGKTAEKVYV